MVWARNAVHSALFLVVTMLCLGVFYVLQAGPFIGMVQIIVYTGAIMMLFLFVRGLVERSKGERVGQVARMQARFAPGSYPAPKAGPGVFATSDSVATPARLPDGTPADRSISKILPTRELTSAEAAPKGTEK